MHREVVLTRATEECRTELANPLIIPGMGALGQH